MPEGVSEEARNSAGIRNSKDTFVIQMHFQQNATWQGTITWADKKKSRRFRSTLEMLKLMDEAISKSRSEDKDGGFNSPAWK